MDAIDRQILFSAVGCILAFAIWKQSRENVLLSLASLIVIGVTIKLGNKVSFPFDYLIWMAGFAVLSVGKSLFVSPKPWKHRLADFNLGFKEYRDAKIAPKP